LSRDRLQRTLADRGAISVADFMAWCLTGEEGSYYRAAEPIGRRGDFITAPEISQTFGELIGLWAGAVWHMMGKPAPVMLVELGPGRGTLMSDALRAGRVVPGFLDAAQLHLVEISERLRETQRAALGGFAPHWHGRLKSVPPGPTILIANEFFDALPLAQFIAMGGGWHERVVRLDAQGNPVFAAGEPAVLPPTSVLPSLAEDGALIEARLSARPLIAEIGRRANSFPLAALIVDYGYGEDAYGDTLQAVSGHGYEDPLAAPGTSDLSAHVNFAELARMAAAEGLAACGPMPQGRFLAGLGLEARLQRLISCARENQRAQLILGARRLVDPYQMGELFKAMALTSPGLPAPPPFAIDPASAGSGGDHD
jgi:NADH dehydrogenase [ubiquinone] 1 alpha subcomplex assembly factor 7